MYFPGDNQKDKEPETSEAIKSAEIKGDFTMEVPVIDLKSINKVTDGNFLAFIFLLWIFHVCCFSSNIYLKNVLLISLQNSGKLVKYYI